MAKLYGYDLDDIDGFASEVFQLLAEHELTTTQAILVLSRTITLVSKEADDLDFACAALDKIVEATVEEDLEEEEDDDTTED